MPPHTTTMSSRSKKTKLRPSSRRSTRLQPVVSPLTSRSNAATMATLGISVSPEPLHRTTQRRVRRNTLPSQFPFGLVGAGPHLFLTHAHRLHRGARLTPQQPA